MRFGDVLEIHSFEKLGLVHARTKSPEWLCAGGVSWKERSRSGQFGDCFAEISDFHEPRKFVLAICRETAGNQQIAGRAFGWSNSRRKRPTVTKVVVVQSSGVVGGIFLKI